MAPHLRHHKQNNAQRPAVVLSSNSVVGQRMAVSLGVELSNRFGDGAVEVIRSVERLMSEVMPLQVAPETLDVVQPRSIVRQPLDGEPGGALGERGAACLAGVDRAVVEDEHEGLDRNPELGPIAPIDLLQESDEVRASFGPAGVNNELALRPVEHPEHRHFGALARRRNAQIGPSLGPDVRQVRMGERFGLVAEEQHDVTGLSLRFEQLPAQARPVHGVGVLPTFQRVAGSPPAEAPLFPQHDGQPRDRDAHACAHLDLIRQTRQRPVRAIGHRRGQDLLGHRQGALSLDGSWPRRDRCLQRLEPPRPEGAAPEPHRILAHPEGLGDLAAGPARQGEQNRPRSVRFAAIPRVAQSNQRRFLFCVCPNRGFARHDPSLKSDQTMESRPASVGQPDHTCLARRHPQIQLAFCLAHARRKFVAVYKATHAPLARDVIASLGEVYATEARIRGRRAEERRAVRQAETKPILDGLKTRLMTALAELPSRSSLVEAIKYMLGHWAGLTVFLEDGRIEVDTNTVERTMRPIALGRKNALFAGSESGARTWAILASLINTAKLNDLDPQTYLADVLERMISGRTPVNRLDELLAWNWKAARDALVTAA